MARARRAVAVVLVAVLALVVTSCIGGDPIAADQARLTVDGVASVTGPDGTQSETAGSSDVDFGSIIEVTTGTAMLELASGATYELRATSTPSRVEVGAPPTLRAGDILVSGGFPASVRYDTATLSAQGAIQVSATTASVKAYAGRTRITGAGALDEVLGLRQVLVTASATSMPLVFDASDEWDRRYLGEAAAFGDRLEALSRGYTGDLQPAPERSEAFFEAVLPGLGREREFTADLIDTTRPIGETLVGAAIALEGRDDTFRERWDQVFAFRDEGAGWGIVALSQGVSSAPLLDTIELAIGTSPLSDDPPEATTTTAPPRTTTPPTVPDGGPGPSAPPTTAPPVITPPTTAPEVDGLLTPLLEPVNEILSGILGLLGLG